MQLKGGQGYMRTEPRAGHARHPHLPDLRGRQRRLRSFAALAALKPLGEELGDLGDLSLGDPIGSLGTLAEYAFGRVKREVRPERSRAPTPTPGLAGPVGDQVKRLRDVGERLLRKHGKDIVHKGMAHRRYADALSDVFAQIATLSRVTSIFEEQGVEASGQERFIAETFCTRAEKRVTAHSTSSTTTTTTGCTRSPGWRTSARPMATPCSRTDPRT